MKTTVVGLSALRVIFPSLKTEVQAERLQVIVTENNHRLGRLVSPMLITSSSKSRIVSSKYFRSNLADLKDKLVLGSLDCVFIQFHGKTKMAFVSERFYKEIASQSS